MTEATLTENIGNILSYTATYVPLVLWKLSSLRCRLKLKFGSRSFLHQGRSRLCAVKHAFLLREICRVEGFGPEASSAFIR